MTLYPEKDAAAYLGGGKPLSIKTLQRWRLDGKGPVFMKIGRLVRYSQADLDRYLSGRIRQSTAQDSDAE